MRLFVLLALFLAVAVVAEVAQPFDDVDDVDNADFAAEFVQSGTRSQSRSQSRGQNTHKGAHKGFFRRAFRSFRRHVSRAGRHIKKTARKVHRRVKRVFRRPKRAKLYNKKVKVEDVEANYPLPLAGDSCPKQLQGLFWLTDQGGKSSLVTFASSPSATKQRKGLPRSGKLKIPVDGDRVWSFSDEGLLKVFKKLDRFGQKHLTYNFRFNNARNPTFAHIDPVGFNGAFKVASWLSDFDMYLTPGDKDYPGSVVWKRNSTALFGKVNLKGGTYKLVQVMNGKGDKLPAWKKWVEFMHTKAAGKTPGYLWYRTTEKNGLKKPKRRKSCKIVHQHCGHSRKCRYYWKRKCVKTGHRCKKRVCRRVRKHKCIRRKSCRRVRKRVKTWGFRRWRTYTLCKLSRRKRCTKYWGKRCYVHRRVCHRTTCKNKKHKLCYNHKKVCRVRECMVKGEPVWGGV